MLVVFFVEFILSFLLFWCVTRETNPMVNNPQLANPESGTLAD